MTRGREPRSRLLPTHATTALHAIRPVSRVKPVRPLDEVRARRKRKGNMDRNLWIRLGVIGGVLLISAYLLLPSYKYFSKYKALSVEQVKQLPEAEVVDSESAQRHNHRCAHRE